MIEVNIPKDIRDYEPTLVGPLTTRKFVCLIIMIALVYGCYMIEKALDIDPLQAPVFLLFAIPPFLMGWYKPYGMYLEKFLGKAIRDNFLAAAKRPYQIENMWDGIIEEEEKAERIEQAKAGNTKGKQEANKQDPKKAVPKEKLPPELKPYK